ncbi:sulfur carrier protein ThiS [Clostridioides mangenotii]|uniref:sulfur carrier protein ThiS n=1 Tax=Metaclostridioides mangenotii TaxID=1540 RepID=UPI00214A5BA8|nr:sulfur carrier protein ThiS [Clostridioides mangenotii]MCR1954015.1 sulfur carrier protein ThiS [Clostridioides mangenotii]
MKVNGKDVELKEGSNVLDLLDNYKLDKNKVVIEVNHIILDGEDYNNYIINKEDTVEIISFVGGG